MADRRVHAHCCLVMPLTAKFLVWEEHGVMVNYGHHLNWIESHLGIGTAHL